MSLMILKNALVMVFVLLALRPLAAEQGGAVDYMALASAIDGQREEARRLRAQWEHERALLQSQAAIYEQLQAQEAVTLRDLQARLAAVAEKQQQAAAAEADARELLAELEALQQRSSKAFRALLRETLLGVVSTEPRDSGAGESLPGRWQALIQALDHAAVQGRLIHRRIRDGQRSDTGQRQVVEILAVGAAALWWRALDDSDYGAVRRGPQGEVLLVPAHHAPTAQAIAQAFALRRGDLPPQMLQLPFPELVPAESP